MKSHYCIVLHLWSTLAYWLHDPGAARASFKFFYKKMILAGQCKGAGEKITFGCLQATYISLKILPVSFKVFHHEVFASELKHRT